MFCSNCGSHIVYITDAWGRLIVHGMQLFLDKARYPFQGHGEQDTCEDVSMDVDVLRAQSEKILWIVCEQYVFNHVNLRAIRF